jgi:hypothetical protein
VQLINALNCVAEIVRIIGFASRCSLVGTELPSHALDERLQIYPTTYSGPRYWTDQRTDPEFQVLLDTICHQAAIGPVTLEDLVEIEFTKQDYEEHNRTMFYERPSCITEQEFARQSDGRLLVAFRTDSWWTGQYIMESGNGSNEYYTFRTFGLYGRPKPVTRQGRPMPPWYILLAGVVAILFAGLSVLICNLYQSVNPIKGPIYGCAGIFLFSIIAWYKDWRDRVDKTYYLTSRVAERHRVFGESRPSTAALKSAGVATPR